MGISNTSKYLQAPFHQHNCIPANKLALLKLNRGVLLKCTKNSTKLILKTKWSRASRDEFTKTARSHKWFFLISCNTLLLLQKFQMNEKPSGRKAIIVKQRKKAIYKDEYFFKIRYVSALNDVINLILINKLNILEIIRDTFLTRLTCTHVYQPNS